MTPPEAPIDGTATTGDTPPAASSCLEVIAVRKDFLAASRARRQPTQSMLVQARKRRPEEPHDSTAIRMGFTCSKKVGNAVARNRAKRRLREVARLTLPSFGVAGHDYVLIGRAGKTASLPFSQLCADLEKALT